LRSATPPSLRRFATHLVSKRGAQLERKYPPGHTTGSSGRHASPFAVMVFAVMVVDRSGCTPSRSKIAPQPVFLGIERHHLVGEPVSRNGGVVAASACGDVYSSHGPLRVRLAGPLETRGFVHELVKRACEPARPRRSHACTRRDMQELFAVAGSVADPETTTQRVEATRARSSCKARRADDEGESG
jgi:hypothetical protein